MSRARNAEVRPDPRPESVERFRAGYDVATGLPVAGHTGSGKTTFVNALLAELGHALLVGPPGSGKSCALAELATTLLAPGKSPALCRLAELDSERDRAWAERWISVVADEHDLAAKASTRQETLE